LTFKVLPVDGPGDNRKARERQKAGSEMALPFYSPIYFFSKIWAELEKKVLVGRFFLNTVSFA
jgi:hypothetical protein